MRNKIRFLTAALAAVLCLCVSPVVAFAGGGEEAPEETVVTETQEEAAAEELNPLTPDGTGTVLDNATDGDGKEFFTIITEDENVFYLIIDRQKETENVYFLNAVTEEDLMALAEKSDTSGTADTTVEETPVVSQEPEPTTEPEETGSGTETESGGGSGGLVFILIAALAAGGAGWYFKIYKPKQQAVDPDEDFEDEYEDYEDGFSGDGAGDYEDATDAGYLPDEDAGDGYGADTGEPDYPVEE